MTATQANNVLKKIEKEKERMNAVNKAQKALDALNKLK